MRSKKPLGDGGCYTYDIDEFYGRRYFKEYKEIEKARKHLEKVVLFNGSLSEYERWKGYECEVIGPRYEQIDLPNSERDYKRCTEDFTAFPSFIELRELCEKGLEAVVNIRERLDITSLAGFGISAKNTIIGLPIRRKR